MPRLIHAPRWLKALPVGGFVFFAAALMPRAALAVDAPASHGTHASHWSYEGPEDPSHWAALSSEFALCGAGRQQSPIDIVASAAAPGAGGAAVRLDRAQPGKVPVDIVNNGHTVQIDTIGSGMLVIGAERYVLQQFHFHTPSEHTVDGRSYPLEVHFVHKSAGAKLAVIGVLFEEGAENVALTPYWSRLPKSAGPPVVLGRGGVDIREILPARYEAYRYAGSLTTPPCSEGVEWLVLKEHLTASAAQIEAFRAIVRHDNRPVQALNGRAVRTDVIR